MKLTQLEPEPPGKRTWGRTLSLSKRSFFIYKTLQKLYKTEGLTLGFFEVLRRGPHINPHVGFFFSFRNE